MHFDMQPRAPWPPGDVGASVGLRAAQARVPHPAPSWETRATFMAGLCCCLPLKSLPMCQAQAIFVTPGLPRGRLGHGWKERASETQESSEVQGSIPPTALQVLRMRGWFNICQDTQLETHGFPQRSADSRARGAPTPHVPRSARRVDGHRAGQETQVSVPGLPLPCCVT